MEEKHFNVLVGSPTSDAHDYVIDRYLDNVKKFTYPNFDLVIVDTSEQLWSKLSSLNVLRLEPCKNIFETLAKARNMLIDYMLEGSYEYFFMLDTDTLPPPDCIERLISYKKDIVGFLNYCGQGAAKKPIVLNSGNFVRRGKRGLDWATQEDIDTMKGLTKVWATSVGSLLVHRKVFEAGVRFRNAPLMATGEDIWFMIEANSSGFEFWLDPYPVVHDSRIKPNQARELCAHIDKVVNKTKVTKAELNGRVKRLELIVATLVGNLKKQGVLKDGN
jgi:GT2 family glycosyltransferase